MERKAGRLAVFPAGQPGDRGKKGSEEPEGTAGEERFLAGGRWSGSASNRGKKRQGRKRLGDQHRTKEDNTT